MLLKPERAANDVTVVLGNGEVGRGQVVLIAQVFGVLEGVPHERLDIAVGIDAADFPIVGCVAAEEQSCKINPNINSLSNPWLNPATPINSILFVSPAPIIPPPRITKNVRKRVEIV